MTTPTLMLAPLVAHDLTPDELSYLADRVRQKGGVSGWKWVRVGEGSQSRRMLNPRVRIEGGRVVEAVAGGDYSAAEIVRTCFAAETRAHERRSASAKRAAKTKAARRVLKVYRVVEELLRNGTLTPCFSCRICGRGLDDAASVARGVGSECWEAILAALTQREQRLADERAAADTVTP